MAALLRASRRARAILRSPLLTNAPLRRIRLPRPAVHGKQGMWVWVAKGDSSSSRGAASGGNNSSEGQHPFRDWFKYITGIASLGFVFERLKDYADAARDNTLTEAVIQMRRDKEEDRADQKQDPVVTVVDEGENRAADTVEM